MSNLDSFLESIGLSQFSPSFREAGAETVDDLQHMDETDLDDMGMKLVCGSMRLAA